MNLMWRRRLVNGNHLWRGSLLEQVLGALQRVSEEARRRARQEILHSFVEVAAQATTAAADSTCQGVGSFCMEPKCARCGQEIKSNDEQRRFLDLRYHFPLCFRCAECDKELDNERPFNNKHAPQCAACHSNQKEPAEEIEYYEMKKS
jgi:hypothetical protein